MNYHVGLRKGLLIAVAAILGVTLLVNILINGLFLERVYVTQEQTKLIAAFNSVVQQGYYDYNTLYSIENDNISIYIVNPDSSTILYKTRPYEPDLEQVVRRIIGDVEYGLSQIAQGEKFFIYSRDETQQSSSGASVAMGKRLTIGGRLASGEYILMESSYEPIAETANLSLWFTLISGLIAMAAALIFAAYFAPKVTAPIEQMKESARSIAGKDFSVRCPPSSINEFASLGDSINKISDEMQRYLNELESANTKLKSDIVEKEKREAARKNLISNISHDLKTPLAIISGYTEGLKSGMASSPEQVQEYCDIINDEADRMLSLIMRLLEISRLESGVAEMELEDFDISEILDYLASSFSLAAMQQQVEIVKDYDEGIYVFSDYFSVEQVLINYVQNALHHGSGHRIVLGVHDLSERVEVRVFNEGAHIPQEEMTRIWDSFYKADKSRTRSHAESGLGLAIVQGNMLLLGMPYGARNVDGGVEFWIHLPKAVEVEGHA